MSFYNYFYIDTNNDHDIKFNNDLIGGKNNNSRMKKINGLNFNVEKVDKYVLDNNMRILLIPMQVNTFSAGFFINAGSRHETEAFGIAHFLEHMTFKGTKNKPLSSDINEFLDSLGAHYNASTSIEFTSYYLSGNPIDSESLLEILIDLYLNPIYPESDIQKERNVVLEEWRMYQDNYTRILYGKIRENLFQGINGLDRPVIGFESSIKKFTRNDILNFRKNYKFDNTVLVIAGNFQKNSIINLIKTSFGQNVNKVKINNNNNNCINNFIIPFDNKPINSRLIYHPKDINQSVIIINFRAPCNKSRYLVHINILSDILTSGFSSRLFNLLRNKLGVTYYSTSYLSVLSDCGIFSIQLGLNPDDSIVTITEIFNELKNIILNGITEKELQIAKKRAETSLLFSFKEPMEFVDHYGITEITNKPYKNIIDIYNDIQNVNIDDINFVAKSLFKKNNLCVAITGNHRKNELTEIEKIINNF